MSDARHGGDILLLLLFPEHIQHSELAFRHHCKQLIEYESKLRSQNLSGRQPKKVFAALLEFTFNSVAVSILSEIVEII